MEDESSSDLQIENEPGAIPLLPFFPEILDGVDEEEFDKIMEERYKAGSGLVTVAAYGYETEPSIETSTFIPSAGDPSIWKVKCRVPNFSSVIRFFQYLIFYLIVFLTKFCV